MPEEKQEGKPDPTPEEKAKEVKPTLEDVSKQGKDLAEKLDKVIKQNSDKDSHISKIENENAKLRETLQKVTTSIEGKPKEKDAILEKQRQKLIDQGYDAEAVDSLLEVVSDIADQKANQRLVPIIMESAQELVESDSEIDKAFLEKNSDKIMSEFNSYKPEVSPRKIKANLKKAYKMVKDSLADEAKKEAAPETEKKRDEMVAGGSPQPKGKKEEPKDDFLDRIDKAGGAKNAHFM